MFCINCGKEIPDDSRFCPFCGTGVSVGVGSTANPTAAASADPAAAAPVSAGRAATASAAGPAYDRPVNTSPIRKARYNLLCILGLVISLISMVFNYFGLVGLGGTIVSVIGLVQCNRRRENGRILGVLGVVFGAIAIITAVIAMM